MFFEYVQGWRSVEPLTLGQLGDTSASRLAEGPSSPSPAHRRYVTSRCSRWFAELAEKVSKREPFICVSPSLCKVDPSIETPPPSEDSPSPFGNFIVQAFPRFTVNIRLCCRRNPEEGSWSPCQSQATSSYPAYTYINLWNVGRR